MAPGVRLSRPPRRQVDGVLLLDKPAGISSNAALQRAKHAYAAAKAGHSGTLDPLASGLLPLCFGEATKFAQALLDARKTYVATVCLGTATATGDREGDVVARSSRTVSRAEFEAVLPRFVGRVQQTPPRHAALKHEGRKYYDYARAGIEIPRVPREIEIGAIEIQDWAPPLVVLRVACGKGTYIRALAEDLAAAAGTCGHLAALRRTTTGPFSLEGAVTLDMLEALAVRARDDLLLPADAALEGVARLDVDAVTARALAEGRQAPAPAGAAGRYRCYGPQGHFVGLVQSAAGALRAVRLLRTHREPAP
jgi:tRNA pseudouridine55 synthase